MTDDLVVTSAPSTGGDFPSSGQVPIRWEVQARDLNNNGHGGGLVRAYVMCARS